jgi:hypothetical protein
VSDPNESFNQGLYGTGPTGNTNWDEYNKGLSTRNMNQAQLDRQNAAFSAPSWPSADPSPAPWTPVGTSGGTGTVPSSGSYGPVSYGTAGPMPAIVAIPMFFLASPVTIPLMIWLYPLTILMALAPAAAAVALIPRIDPTLDLSSRIALGSVVAVIAFWPLSRVDYWLAKNVLYRTLRHLARLAVVGGYVFYNTSVTGRGPASGSLVAAVVAAGLAHLVLKKGPQSFWQGVMRSVRLHPR